MVPTATTLGFVIRCIEAGSAGVLETVLVMKEIIPDIDPFDLFLAPYLLLIWSLPMVKRITITSLLSRGSMRL